CPFNTTTSTGGRSAGRASSDYRDWLRERARTTRVARLAQLLWATRYLDIPGLAGGDKPLILVHLARTPAAHPLKQPGEARVDGGVLVQDEAHPVAAGLELAALAATALCLRHRLREPLRARGAELD